MGERTTGLDTRKLATTTDGTGDADSPRETVRLLESQIGDLRDELGDLVAELDRRRHAAFDVKLQVRRHGREVVLSGVALVGAAAGIVWLGVWRARRRQRLGARVDRFRQAMGRMIDRPERVAAEPTVPMKIFNAAASAVVATVIKKVLERVVHEVLERQRLATTESETPARPLARPKPPRSAVGA